MFIKCSSYSSDVVLVIQFVRNVNQRKLNLSEHEIVSEELQKQVDKNDRG